MFNCEHCGCCCRNLDKNIVYTPLDRGDGTCKYLKGDDCMIYKRRPLICRIDESYDRFFANQISREKYYTLNKEVCKLLQKLEE